MFREINKKYYQNQLQNFQRYLKGINFLKIIYSYIDFSYNNRIKIILKLGLYKKIDSILNAEAIVFKEVFDFYKNSL